MNPSRFLELAIVLATTFMTCQNQLILNQFLIPNQSNLMSDLGEVLKKIVDAEKFPDYQLPKKTTGRKKGKR
jgi:hypothetical protein